MAGRRSVLVKKNTEHGMHFILWDGLYKRTRSIRINNRLLFFHKVVALTLFIYFIYQGLSDESLVEDYRARGIFYYIILSYVAFFGANILAAGIMYLPALIFAKNISPEILLFDSYLIYLGGSLTLNYVNYISLFPFFRYLLGLDESELLVKTNIKSVGFEKAKFLKPAYGFGNWISIVHEDGKVLTGLRLEDEAKIEIINDINLWKNREYR